MLNNQQIKLVQTAVRKAGIRGKGFDGRYRMLLGKYQQPGGQRVTSCKQLNNYQLEDMLAICEAYGWQCPGKEENHFRKKIASQTDMASFAQQEAIKHLAGDLGWNSNNTKGFISKMTKDRTDSPVDITPGEAWKIIEALKAMVCRKLGISNASLKTVKERMEAVRDGKTCQV